LVRAGQIEIRAGVRSMGETHVTFEDGSSSRFDAIVLATGFRPGVERFLQRPNNVFLKERTHGESRVIGDAGLYFCGFFVSPTGMFRDIAMEARWIAEHITHGTFTPTLDDRPRRMFVSNVWESSVCWCSDGEPGM
jgi:indole-3-pyruvate monooxygenase